MRLYDVMRLMIRYMGLGIKIFALLAIICIAGYACVYKKILKGKKRLNWKVMVWCLLFICYISVVIGATLLGRGGTVTDGKVQPLFYSYKDAWINFSKAAWRNIILNYCMFMPLGVMLPLGIKWFQKFWKTYLAGFGGSLLIEIFQLVCDKGMFECDDILGNTIGTMIGYGLFAGILAIINMQQMKRKIYPLLLQLPLLITVAMFSLIFIQYDLLELGINPNNYVVVYNSDLIHVAGDDFSNEADGLPVYKISVFTIDETQKNGEKTLEKLGSGIDELNLDIYDNTLVMNSEDGRYSLWMEYYGGTYSLTDFETLYPDTGTLPEPKEGVTEDVIREAVNKLGIEIPDDSKFAETGSGIYKFTVDMVESDRGLLDGAIECQYYGEYGIGQLMNQVLSASFYKEFDAISEQEAYQKLVDGEFQYLGHENLTIQIESCSIVYCIDSKGYYQPNYCFQCNINGKEDEIIIPALK